MYVWLICFHILRNYVMLKNINIHILLTTIVSKVAFVKIWRDKMFFISFGYFSSYFSGEISLFFLITFLFEIQKFYNVTRKKI